MQVGLERAVCSDAASDADIHSVLLSPDDIDDMLRKTTQLTGWIHRLAQTMATATPKPSFAVTQDHCPHCGQDTLWVVHAVSGFYRCRQCNNNPLDGTDTSSEA